MSFMMKRSSKMGDVLVSVLGEAYATDRHLFQLVPLNGSSDLSPLPEQSLEVTCVAADDVVVAADAVVGLYVSIIIISIIIITTQRLQEYCVRHPLPSSGSDFSFRTCMVELMQVTCDV